MIFILDNILNIFFLPLLGSTLSSVLFSVCRSHRKNEKRLGEEINRLQGRLDKTLRENADLNQQLSSKIEEMRILENTEIKQLNTDLSKVRYFIMLP